MTAVEFLSLSEDEGVYRELIDGELREYPVNTRSPLHSYVTSQVGFFLKLWLRDQASLKGVVVAGDARCRLTSNPETIVGIDVAVFLGDKVNDILNRSVLFDKPPELAVEVLSPSDTHENMVEKIRKYRDAGVPQVWIVDPDLETVTVYRPDGSSVHFHRNQTLSGDPDLSGFEVRVSDIFTV
jgi:Uma2 family endonuclease